MHKRLWFLVPASAALLLCLLRRGVTQRGELEREVVQMLNAAPVTVRNALGELRQERLIKGGARRTGRPPKGESPWTLPVELTLKGREAAEEAAEVLRGLVT